MVLGVCESGDGLECWGSGFEDAGVGISGSVGVGCHDCWLMTADIACMFNFSVSVQL